MRKPVNSKYNSKKNLFLKILNRITAYNPAAIRRACEPKLCVKIGFIRKGLLLSFAPVTLYTSFEPSCFSHFTSQKKALFTPRRHFLMV